MYFICVRYVKPTQSNAVVQISTFPQVKTLKVFIYIQPLYSDTSK